MKIYAISDLHISTNSNKPMDVFGGNWLNYLEKIREDWTNKVKEDDLVLIGGDISWAMNLEDALQDIKEFSDLKGTKVIIKGNHDYWWQTISRVRDSLPQGIYALQNDSIRLDNVIICGSRLWSVPGSPNFTEQDNKLYLREQERLRLSLKDAIKERQEDKLVALVHFPPFNVRREENEFTKLFEEYGVDIVVYGHLHGKDVRADKLVEKNGVKYYLTSCDLVENKLVEIQL